MATRQLTIAQTIIASLLARGYTVVIERGRTSKYTVLHQDSMKPAWIWVGAAGACRGNSEKRVSDSIPLSDRVRATLLAGRADNLNATSI